MDQAVRQKQVTILDLLDRILDKGVLVLGDVTISVADVDLVYLGLKVLASSTETAERMKLAGLQSAADGGMPGPAAPANPRPRPRVEPFEKLTPREDFVAETERAESPLPRRINADPENVERGLAKLVLTLIELVRRLLERQAARRVEGGSLNDDEIERLGETFMKLSARMDELKAVFGLTNEDLNINLGPLGDLL